MPFLRPTLADLVGRIMTDLTTRLGLSGAALRRSVIGVLARVVAGAVHLLHGHLDYLSKQLFPDTSEVEYLERQASLYGIARLPATFATGAVVATGLPTSVIPEDTRLQRSDGVEYATQAEAIVDGTGSVLVSVDAVEAGVGGNAEIDVVLTFVSPISGVTATAPVTVAISGGTDTESDDALRERLLTRMRQPPQGGSEADYITWAKEVAGVTRAWVYPSELGPGTVTVRFMRDGDLNPIPDAGEVAAVQAHMDPLVPVTADLTVLAPIADTLNFTIEISPDTSATRAAVQAELTDLLTREAEPGSTILRSQIDVAVGTAAGVNDFSVTVPAADVTHVTGHIATFGSISWT